MRYLVFAFDQYYPFGGMGDCILKTDDLDEALSALRSQGADWAQVYDTETGKMVLEN